MALTQIAHDRLSDHIHSSGKPPGIAVDATCGNGFDTEFLCRLGFRHVIGFDIQQRAIDMTRLRLENADLSNFELHQAGHEKMGHYVQEAIDCVVFNLGYLPHGNKTIATSSHSSVQALELACSLLGPLGIISVLCYPGHRGGAAETNAVKNFLSQLDDTWQIDEHLSTTPTPRAPILYVLTRSED